MTQKERIKSLQHALNELGAQPPLVEDGIWGPKSQVAFDRAISTDAITSEGKLVGDGTWRWMDAEIVGEDIVIHNAVVTAFGGASDSMDSGETASGISTKNDPGYIGCALPMRRDKSSALRGSPIPKLPWKTEVMFVDPKLGKSLMTKLIDEGPAKWTEHGGDLTVAAAKFFDPNATANSFRRTMDIWIKGGAKYA